MTNLNPHICGGISAEQQGRSFVAWLGHRASAVRTLACCSCLRVDEATAAQVAHALRLIGRGLRSFEFDCYSSSYSADGLPTVLRALRCCQGLQTLSLKGEHCLIALARAGPDLACGWAGLHTLSLSFKGQLPPLVCGWTTLETLRLTLCHPETLKWRPDDDILALELPGALSALRRLNRLAIDFADARPGEHPGEGNELAAGKGLQALAGLKDLRLGQCSLMGDDWPGAWAGLVGLTQLAFVNCLGESVGFALQAVRACL